MELTGKNDGIAQFQKLIDEYFPNVKGKAVNLNTDNPFPLLPQYSRTVSISASESQDPFGTNAGKVVIQAYPNASCPLKEYSYTIYNLYSSLTITATVKGFAAPVFQWKINGVPIGSNGLVQLDAGIEVDIPSHPDSPDKSTQLCSVSISNFNRESSSWNQMSRNITVSNISIIGHIILNVEVIVSEQNVDNGSTSGFSILTLDTQKLVFDYPYYSDRNNCEYGPWLSHSRKFEQWKYINILKTLPDPPNDPNRSVQLWSEIITEVAIFERKNPQLAHNVIAMIAQKFMISQEFVRASIKAISTTKKQDEIR